MYLEDLVKRSYIKSEPATDEEITLLLAGCRPQVDQHLVVSKSDFETVLMENRATDPTSEAVLMTIGRAGISPGDPIWDVMLKRDCVVSHYTRLCNNEAAEQLSALDEAEEKMSAIGEPPAGDMSFMPPPPMGVPGNDHVMSKEEIETMLQGDSWPSLPDGKRLATAEELPGGSVTRKPPAFEFEVLGHPEDEPPAEEPPAEVAPTQASVDDGFSDFGFGAAGGLGGVSAPAEAPASSDPPAAVASQPASVSDGMDIYLDDPDKHRLYEPDIAFTDVVEDAPGPGPNTGSEQGGDQPLAEGSFGEVIPSQEEVAPGDEAPQEEGPADVSFGAPPADDQPPAMEFGVPLLDGGCTLNSVVGMQPPDSASAPVEPPFAGMGSGLGIGAFGADVPGVAPPNGDTPMGLGFGLGFEGAAPVGLGDAAEPPAGEEEDEPPLADMSDAEGVGPMFPVMEVPPAAGVAGPIIDFPPAPAPLAETELGDTGVSPRSFNTFDIPDAPRPPEPPAPEDIPKQMYDVPGYVAPAPVEEEAVERYEAPVSDGVERVRPGFIGLGPQEPDEAPAIEPAPVPVVEDKVHVVPSVEEPAPVPAVAPAVEHPVASEDNEHLKVVRTSFDLFHSLVRQYTLDVILASEGLTPESFCLQLVEEFPQFGDQYEASLSNYGGSYDRAVRDLVQSLQLEAESAVFAGDLDRAETCIAPVCKLIYD